MALGQVFPVRVRSRPTKTGPVLDVPLPRVLVSVDRRVTVGAAWKRTFLNGLNYNSQLLLTTNNLQKKFKIKHEFQKWVIIKLLSLIFSFFYNRIKCGVKRHVTVTTHVRVCSVLYVYVSISIRVRCKILCSSSSLVSSLLPPSY